MKGTLVPAVKTPLTAIEALRALREGYRRVIGRDPTPACLAVHVSQSALETGRWKSLWNNNFGNVKAGASYEGFYCQFRCNEIINGKVQWFDPPHPQTNFRAYPSAVAGAEAHMKFLTQNKRYALAWTAAERGDPDEFVVALKQAGYFTANLEPYRKAVNSLFREFMAALRDMGPLSEPPPVATEETKHSPASDEDLDQRLPVVYSDIAPSASHVVDLVAETMRRSYEESEDERRKARHAAVTGNDPEDDEGKPVA